jgi:hypothetical protein
MTQEPRADHTAPAENPSHLLQFVWVKLLVFGVTATVLAGVLSLYLQPTFLVTLASQVWACF